MSSLKLVWSNLCLWPLIYKEEETEGIILLQLKIIFHVLNAQNLLKYRYADLNYSSACRKWNICSPRIKYKIPWTELV